MNKTKQEGVAMLLEERLLWESDDKILWCSYYLDKDKKLKN